MRILFTRSRLGPVAAWLWPFALLALPGCASLLNVQDVSYSSPVSPRGNLPESSVVFCQIEQAPRKCLDPVNQPGDAAILGMGVRLEDAAVAFVDGANTTIGLDYSPDTLRRCNQQPEASFYYGRFPEGTPVCLNCLTIAGGGPYADANALCVSTCKDLFKASKQSGDADAFCGAHARVADNFDPLNACLANSCKDGSMLRDGFADPRGDPEPVEWIDLTSGMTHITDGIRRTTTPINSQDFTEGADSGQLITHGNAYMEFTVGQTKLTRVIGLSHGLPDTNPDYRQIDYAFSLFGVSLTATEQFLYIFEAGNKPCPANSLPSPPAPEPCASRQLLAGETYRIHVIDNLDGTGPYAPQGGTATVRYERVTGTCIKDHPCATEVLYPSQTPAHYPLRVDSSFHDEGAELTGVRLVRIQHP